MADGTLQFDPSTHPHRRFNPLTGEHVLVSPHRTKRPWQGQTEPPSTNTLPEYDPKCYLCPGNDRSGGQTNPTYTGTLTFQNDFPALLDEAPDVPPAPHPLLTSQPVQGACDVLIFHPRHDLTLARLSISDIERVITEWTRVYESRGGQEGIKYVQIFENKGAMMGCSNPHPHGQVWSAGAIPTIPSQELRSLAQYAMTPASAPQSGAPLGRNGNPCMLCEYAHFECGAKERVVLEEQGWLVVVPWWAVWPFEVLVLPTNRHITSLLDLTASERTSFAQTLSRLTKKYDNLFNTSFAYSMGIHQRPTPSASGEEGDVAHLHLHFYPPLLRSATVRKFLVGFELMAEAQRDLTPEQAAVRLRECSEVHYLDLEEEKK